jgi:hypothetical protein
MSAANRTIDVTTREFCQRCHRLNPVGFYAPDDIWEAVAARQWEHSILCILCFAQLGDEKHIAWEAGLRLFPVSYATHHALRSGAFRRRRGGDTWHWHERCSAWPVDDFDAVAERPCGQLCRECRLFGWRSS